MAETWLFSPQGIARTGFTIDVAISDVRRRAASSSRDGTGESEKESEFVFSFSPLLLFDLHTGRSH
jgi:hypothetical protein